MALCSSQKDQQNAEILLMELISLLPELPKRVALHQHYAKMKSKQQKHESSASSRKGTKPEKKIFSLTLTPNNDNAKNPSGGIVDHVPTASLHELKKNDEELFSPKGGLVAEDLKDEKLQTDHYDLDDGPSSDVAAVLERLKAKREAKKAEKEKKEKKNH